jgi:hypothetical protein
MATLHLGEEVESLRREVADLKKQLAAYQAGRHHTSEEAGRPESKAFRFLDLPRVLRNAVYELCVVVDKV